MDAIDIEALPEGWASWELEPIDWTGRRSAEELMVAKGKLTAQVVTKKVLEREPGSRLRTRLLTVAIRGGFGLTNRREYEQLFASGYTEDCELTFEAFFPDMNSEAGAGVHGSREALKRYMESFDDAYRSLEFQPHAIVDPGGNRFAVAAEVTAVGRSTGISIAIPFGVIYDVYEGQVSRQRNFRDWTVTLERLKHESGGRE